jgi:4-hydroxy-3-methylbut-2-en-1-yl diphosphate synthase IspG/GcpE
MNPYKEYMAMSLKGLKNLNKVLEGVATKTANQFKLLSNEKQIIIADRMDICINCPYNSRNAVTSPEYVQLTGKHYSTDRNELHCSFCGCIATYKTASLSSDCGIADWNADHPLHKIELKWKRTEQ